MLCQNVKAWPAIEMFGVSSRMTVLPRVLRGALFAAVFDTDADSISSARPRPLSAVHDGHHVPEPGGESTSHRTFPNRRCLRTQKCRLPPCHRHPSRYTNITLLSIHFKSTNNISLAFRIVPTFFQIMSNWIYIFVNIIRTLARHMLQFNGDIIYVHVWHFTYGDLTYVHPNFTNLMMDDEKFTD